jgi:hypothetical protein
VLSLGQGSAGQHLRHSHFPPFDAQIGTKKRKNEKTAVQETLVFDTAWELFRFPEIYT